MDNNPFVTTTSPMEGMTPDQIAPDANSQGSFNLTSQIGGLANVKPGATENETLSNLQLATQDAKALLDKSDEQRLRYNAAADRLTSQQTAIRSLKTPDLRDPAMNSAIDQTLRQNVQTDLETQAKSALERQAVDNVHTLLTNGDTVEAQVAINRIARNRGTPLDVIREDATKRLIVQQALDKANVDTDNEAWIHWGAAGLLNLLPTNYTFGLLGNVKPGVGGYRPSWYRFFFPGSDFQKQGEALGSLTAEQLHDYMPELIQNLRDNATTLGIQDPARVSGGLHDLFYPSPNDVFMKNLYGAVDIGGVIPWGTVAKIGRVPFNLASLGARKAAGAAVAGAVDSIVREGEEAAVAKTGVTAAEATDHALPSIINPERLPGEPMVSLNNDVNQGLAVARDVVKEMGLPGTSRFVDSKELNEAIEGAKNRIRERVGSDVKDFEVVPRTLPDGSVVHSLEATVGGHATEAEAVNFLESRGISSVDAVEPIRETVEKSVSPRDEGFNIVAYHGTHGEFSEFNDGLRGSNTGVPMAKGATFFSDNPEVAGQYSKLAYANSDEFVAAEGRYNAAKREFGPRAKQTVQARKEFREVANGDGNIRPQLLKFDNPLVADMKGAKMNNEGMSQIIEAAKKKGYDGIVLKNVRDNFRTTDKTTSTVYAAFDTSKSVRSTFDLPRTVQDVSEQWFSKVRMDIPETGFYTSPLKVPDQGFLAKFWQNTSQTSDRRLFEKATSAGNKRNRMQKIIDGDLTKAFRQLSKDDRAWVEQILMKGTNLKKWFSDEEFSTIFERASGKPPSAAAKTAYLQFRVNNDIEHVLRDNDLYKSKLIRGFESMSFNTQGAKQDLDGIVDYAPSTVPRERVYNLSDDVHYTTGDNKLTESRLETLRNQGYLHVRTENPIDLPDGSVVQDFLMRRGDVELRELRTQQLAYSEGGHRLYTHKYFVKQAQEGVQADTGKAYLKNPNTFVTAPTIKHARDWAETMNEAVEAIKNGATPGFVESNVFKGRAGFPKADEIVDHLNSGFISDKHPFEAVFDRELPSLYNNKEDMTRFMDEEVGFNGYYRTTGRMYYSAKGEHLPDVTGELAPTVDPFEAQSQALYNVSQMSSFSDFKTSSIDRWVRNYRPYLNMRELPEDVAGSPANTFNSASIAKGTPISLRQQIEGQRESIKRILGFESDYDRGYRNFMRNTAEWVVGDSDSKLRSWASQAVFKMQDNNPVNFLRGLAFDAKLGFFNVGQLFLQSSTMASAIALSPKYGLQGMASGLAINGFFKSKGSEAVLDLISKRGLWKMAGFGSEEEFKDYARTALKGGFFDLGDTHVLVHNYGPQTTFGSLSGGIDAARNMGRMFFYEGEVWNRLVAHRIAYGEAAERFGVEARESPEFKEFLAGRAENYSFNMSDQSKAWWQSGLLSIPTQFWAYNVRMLEAMTGKDFTAAQKMRLIAANLGIAGTGGLPVIAGVSEYIKQKYNYEPDIHSMLGTLDRGVVDRMMAEIFDADVSIGERIGTGSWSSNLIKDIFGMSEYNDKSFADMAFGATYSITKQAVGTAAELAKFYMTHESGSEEDTLTKDQWIALGRQISTVNNFLKARMIYRYGTYQSTRGTMLADGLPSQDAMFAALGVNPHEVDTISVYMANSKQRSDDVNDLSRVINNYWQEAMTNPDKFTQNAKNVNALMQMVPPELKTAVLQKTHAGRDPSLYSSLLRRKEENDAQLKLIQGVQNGPTN